MIDKRNILKEHLPWCIDYVEVLKDYIIIKGWAYHDKDIVGEIFCNDVQACVSNYNKNRKDLPVIFPFWNEAKIAGFECHYILKSESDVLEFNYDVAGIGTNILRNYFFKVDDLLPTPDEKCRIRVHGSPLLPAFKLEGYSSYRKIKHLIKKNISFIDNENIRLLDWGCGCGRVSRYLRADYRNIWGADIDPKNLSWCEQNLKMQTIELGATPTGILPENSFDVIFGISVMSHLSLDHQILWLRELYDSLSENGILLLSFHGVSSALRSMSNELFSRFLSEGYWNLRENQSLQEILPGYNGYRDVYNTLENIKINWSKQFQILEIYESIIGNNQDLVIFKKH